MGIPRNRIYLYIFFLGGGEASLFSACCSASSFFASAHVSLPELLLGHYSFWWDHVAGK